MTATVAAEPSGSRYTARLAGSIKPYEPSDRTALRAFQREHFGAGSRQCDDRYFEWLFERNPSRRADEAVIWLCKRDGAIVGQQAQIPVVLKIGGREFQAAWGIDLMVHPDWRLKGVGPALFNHYQCSSKVLLGLGLSVAARRTCLRAGWSDLGMLPLLARPLDIQACSDALRTRAKLAKFVPDSIVKGTARAAAILVKSFSGCSLVRVHEFDERIDHVWTTAASDYPVLAKRDFCNLRWRFDEVPDRQRYERYYFTHRGKLAGYAVVRADVWRGHKVIRVVDYLCETRWKTALLALVIDAMRERHIAAVFLEQLRPSYDKGLLPLGCFAAGAATRFMAKAQGLPPSTSALLLDSSRWCVSRSDSDSDLPGTD